MTGIVASPLGLLIGLSLGAVGGGGSVLTVPVLVYIVGEGTSQATTTSLMVVGLASVVGAIPHWRAGRVRLGSGIVFGLAGAAGAVAGSRLSTHVSERALLLGFASLMVVVAVAMLRRAADTDPTTDASATCSAASTAARVVGAGTVVGLLAGFFGVGGGFVIVPALVFALRFTMPVAIGTSLVVIALNSLVALLARLGSSSVDWSVALPFALAALIGVLAGSAVTSRVDPRILGRALALLLLVVAAYVAVRATLSSPGATS